MASKNPIRHFQKKYRTLFYLVIFGIGLLIVFVSLNVEVSYKNKKALNSEETLNNENRPSSEEVSVSWENFLIELAPNLAAGFFLASIMYFLISYFEVDEDGASGDLLKEIGKIKNKLNSVFDNSEANMKLLQKLVTTDNVIKPIFNEALFNQRLCELIMDANSSILYIGDGFSCHDKNNEEFAETFEQASWYAINSKRNLTYKYYQWGTTLNLKWLKRLISLKGQNNYEIDFRVFISNERNEHIPHPNSTIIIDPGEEGQSICLKFTKDSNEHIKSYYEFGAAFIFNNRELIEKKNSFYQSYFGSNEVSRNELQQLYDTKKERLEKAVDELVEKDSSVLDISRENVQKVSKALNVLDFEYVKGFLLKNMLDYVEFIFVTDIYMDESLLSRICKRCNKVCTFVLPEFTYGFNIESRHGVGKGGGMLNIYHTAIRDDYVAGVVYAIYKNEIEKYKKVMCRKGFKAEHFRQLPYDFDLWESEEFLGGILEGQIINYFSFQLNGKEKGAVPLPTDEYIDKLENAMTINEIPQSEITRVKALGDGKPLKSKKW